LYAAWGGNKRWREIPRTAHDNIAAEPDYWREIAAYLTDLR